MKRFFCDQWRMDDLARPFAALLGDFAFQGFRRLLPRSRSPPLPRHLADPGIPRPGRDRRRAARLLKSAAPDFADVLWTTDIGGLSTDQTAVVLNQSHAAVKARLWRARLQPREGLNRYFRTAGRFCANRGRPSPQPGCGSVDPSISIKRILI